MHRQIHDDIARGRGVAVVDPHGQLVSDILQHSIPPEREEDVVVLDIANRVDGVHYPPPLNLLALPQGVERDIAVGQIMGVLEKIYPEFAATEMADTAYHAILTLSAETNPTVMDVDRVFDDLAYRNQLLQQIDNMALHKFWGRMDALGGRRDLMIYPVLRRMSLFYRNRHLYPIMCHPAPLNLGRLMAENKIILFSLHADEARIPETERRLLGAIIVSQLQMTAMTGIIKQRPFYLYIDEAQHFVTTALGQMLSEARKYGLSLTVANQYLKQLAGHTLDAVMGTAGAMIFFELGQPDATAVTRYVKPHFDSDDLMHLGRFRAVVSMRHCGEKQPAFSIETLPPPRSGNQAAAQRAAERERALRRASIKRHTPASYDEVVAGLDARYKPIAAGSTGRDDDFSDAID